MSPWDQAWDNATVAERKTVRYWKPGFGKKEHRNGLRGDRNQCPSCGEFFNSSHAFDKHRTGSFGRLGVPSSRRCLTVPEMVGKGHEKNYAGFWITLAYSFDAENADSSCV